MEIILASCLEEDILPVFIRGSERGGKLGIDATQWLSKGKSLSMVVSRWRVFALKTFPSRPFLLAFLFPLSPFQERSLPFPLPSLPVFSFVPPFFLFPPSTHRFGNDRRRSTLDTVFHFFLPFIFPLSSPRFIAPRIARATTGATTMGKGKRGGKSRLQ